MPAKVFRSVVPFIFWAIFRNARSRICVCNTMSLFGSRTIFLGLNLWKDCTKILISNITLDLSVYVQLKHRTNCPIVFCFIDKNKLFPINDTYDKFCPITVHTNQKLLLKFHSPNFSMTIFCLQMQIDLNFVISASKQIIKWSAMVGFSI